jgi:uncharacterized protein
MNVIHSAFFGCLIYCSSLFAQEPSELDREIEKLFKITDTEAQMAAAFREIIQILGTNRVDAPPGFWNSVEEKINTSALASQAKGVFRKHFSFEEIKAINAFYESSAGRKILASMPQIMQECSTIGQKAYEAAIQQAIEEHEAGKANREFLGSLGIDLPITSEHKDGPSEIERNATPQERLTTEQKEKYLRSKGLDPNRYDVEEIRRSGFVEFGPKPPSATYRDKAHYQLRVRNGGSYFSEKEPRKQDGMFKFIDLRTGKETQVSADGVVITKLK